MFQDLGRGIAQFWKAFGFIFKNNLWHYYLYPLLLMGLLFWGISVVGDMLADWAEIRISAWFGLDAIVEEDEMGFWTMVLNTIKEGTAFIAKWGIKLAIIVTGGILTKYIMLILLSPVLAFLSESVEKKLTGNDYPFDFKQIMKDVVRGVGLAMRNMFIEFGCIILGWCIIFFVPVLAIVISPALWILGWYFYGFSMMDYVNERRRMKVSESVRFVRKHKGIAIGNGWMFAVGLSIPFIGYIFAPINACVGATLAIHEVVNLGDNPYAVNKKLEYQD